MTFLRAVDEAKQARRRLIAVAASLPLMALLSAVAVLLAPVFAPDPGALRGLQLIAVLAFGISSAATLVALTVLKADDSHAQAALIRATPDLAAQARVRNGFIR